MGAGQRVPSPPAAAAVPLLLLFVVPFWSRVASADGGASAWTTALEKHVAFFDTDNDGIVTFSETEQGLRAIGLGAVEATVKATLINGAIGPKTRPENATTSKFSIYIANIQKGIHGSDSGSYDAQGRFVPAKFNEIFTKHAKVEPNAVIESELEAMRTANREDGDAKGWAASKAEWGLLYSLAKDKDGFLQKDTARTVYDGSLVVRHHFGGCCCAGARVSLRPPTWSIWGAFVGRVCSSWPPRLLWASSRSCLSRPWLMDLVGGGRIPSKSFARRCRCR